jgi:hypothetical protein
MVSTAWHMSSHLLLEGGAEVVLMCCMAADLLRVTTNLQCPAGDVQ